MKKKVNGFLRKLGEAETDIGGMEQQLLGIINDDDKLRCPHCVPKLATNMNTEPVDYDLDLEIIGKTEIELVTGFQGETVKIPATKLKCRSCGAVIEIPGDVGGITEETKSKFYESYLSIMRLFVDMTSVEEYFRGTSSFEFPENYLKITKDKLGKTVLNKLYGQSVEIQGKKIIKTDRTALAARASLMAMLRIKASVYEEIVSFMNGNNDGSDENEFDTDNYQTHVKDSVPETAEPIIIRQPNVEEMKADGYGQRIQRQGIKDPKTGERRPVGDIKMV